MGIIPVSGNNMHHAFDLIHQLQIAFIFGVESDCWIRVVYIPVH